MKSSLFITGASGFIAGNFLQRINPEDYRNIYCLSRNESEVLSSLSKYSHFRFIKGSIFDVDRYTMYLASSDIVMHFAAITGKAKPGEYFKVNATGTRLLIRQCEQAGVRNFLYISSIAVIFSDISRYYYARSKKEGEDAVRSSTMNYTIVRPTMVIGRGSPILESLSRLARAPVTPIFGDGAIKIQPIFVGDLVDCLLDIIHKKIFMNEIFELGGPDIITIEEFIQKIHQFHYKKRARTVHISLRLLIPLLSFLEKYFYSHLPFTVGQLSSFRFDSTIEENRLFLMRLPHMKGIDEMLETETDDMDNNLKKECRIFCNYLINQNPDKYILEKYQDGHGKSNISKASGSNRFDQLVIAIARINPFFTKLADSYTRIFFKCSLLRKKLILLLAILESSASTHRCFDSEDPDHKMMSYIKMFQEGLFFFFMLLLSTVILMPLRLIVATVSKPPDR